jgi:hypothetical protein
MRQAVVVLALSVVVVGCGPAPPPMPMLGNGPPAMVTGVAWAFGSGGSTVLTGAKISVAESPSITTTVAADGTYAIAVPSGGEASLVLELMGYHIEQTATLTIPATGVEHVAFQAPDDKSFDLLSSLINVYPDDTRCQIATTVSKPGTLYAGDAMGEPDTVVTLDPPVADATAIYFKYISGSLILPDKTLTATSVDGGVLWANVEPGIYTLVATKNGAKFTSPKVWCRPGVLVNAAPPWGIQEQ